MEKNTELVYNSPVNDSCYKDIASTRHSSLRLGELSTRQYLSGSSGVKSFWISNALQLRCMGARKFPNGESIKNGCYVVMSLLGWVERSAYRQTFCGIGITFSQYFI